MTNSLCMFLCMRAVVGRNRVRRSITMTRLASSSTQTWSVAREQETRYLVGSLNVWSLESSAVTLTDIDWWRQTDPRSHGRHQQGLSRRSRKPIEGGGGGDKVPVGNRPPRTRQLCLQAPRHLRRTACCAPLLRLQVPRPTRLRDMLRLSCGSWIQVGPVVYAHSSSYSEWNVDKNWCSREWKSDQL